MSIGFGYRVEQYNATFEQLVKTAKLAELLGFDGIWLNDHWVPDPISGRYEAPTFECWTTAGALAMVTSRVRIGFMTLCNEYRLPSVAAKTATSLDVLSGGRVDFGMGAGWHEDEFRMFGFPYPDGKTRLDRLEEGLQIMRGMFENEEFTFHGEHYDIDGAWNNPRPVQPGGPPVWIGGAGEKRMLRIVAQYADWHNLVVTPIEQFKRKMEILDRHCVDLGREPGTLKRSLNPSLLLRETDEQFESYAAERAAKRNITVDEYLELLRSQGTIFGGPERATRMLQEYVDAGCSYFEFIVRETDQETPLQIFSERIKPHFVGDG
jgi:F420-dependent oxidoreductase-like protein